MREGRPNHRVALSLSLGNGLKIILFGNGNHVVVFVSAIPTPRIPIILTQMAFVPQIAHPDDTGALTWISRKPVAHNTRVREADVVRLFTVVTATESRA